VVMIGMRFNSHLGCPDVRIQVWNDPAKDRMSLLSISLWEDPRGLLFEYIYCTD
jgi:hypothetical protein